MNWLLSGDDRGGAVRRTRAVEAAEYVCDTLGFSNIQEVLEYFSTVKSMELRVKKMISGRKHRVELAETEVDVTNQLATDAAHCLPRSISKLDADIERLRRDGLERQIKRRDEVNERITEYRTLINELWFHLDSMSGKLKRCQVRAHNYHVYCRTRVPFDTRPPSAAASHKP